MAQFLHNAAEAPQGHDGRTPITCPLDDAVTIICFVGRFGEAKVPILFGKAIFVDCEASGERLRLQPRETSWRGIKGMDFQAETADQLQIKRNVFSNTS